MRVCRKPLAPGQAHCPQMHAGQPRTPEPGSGAGQAHGRLRNTWGNEAGWDFLGKSGRVRVVGEAGARPFPVQDLPAEEPLDGGRKEVVKTGPWGRFGQGSFPLTPTPLPGLGETSDKPDPACHLGSSRLPSGGLSGGLGHGQKEGGSRCGSPGALQAKPGEVLRARRGCRGPGGPWGGELGGRAPSSAAIAREAAPLSVRTASVARPGLSPACPAGCLGLSTFLQKMWVCCKGELRQERK